MTPHEQQQFSKILFDLIPTHGASVGNVTLLQNLKGAAKKKLRFDITDEDYWDIRNKLISAGKIARGRGRGGSVYRLKEVKVNETKAYSRPLPILDSQTNRTLSFTCLTETRRLTNSTV